MAKEVGLGWHGVGVFHRFAPVPSKPLFPRGHAVTVVAPRKHGPWGASLGGQPCGSSILQE